MSDTSEMYVISGERRRAEGGERQRDSRSRPCNELESHRNDARSK